MSYERQGPIDTGDHVLHRLSGESWVVAYVQGDKLCPCGWPESLANLADCTLIQQASDDERRDILIRLARSPNGNDSRVRYAMHRTGLR